MALAPKRVMHRKVQRGRQHGFATRDNYIDFGLYEARNKNQRAVNDWEPVILMDFNVDGNLYEDPKLYSLLKKKMNTGKTHLFTIK